MKKDFDFWQLYSELAIPEKIFISFGTFAGLNSKLKVKDSIDNFASIEDVIKSIMDDKDEYKELKKQVIKSPNALITRFKEKEVIQEEFKKTYSNFFNKTASTNHAGQFSLSIRFLMAFKFKDIFSGTTQNTKKINMFNDAFKRITKMDNSLIETKIVACHFLIEIINSNIFDDIENDSPIDVFVNYIKYTENPKMFNQIFETAKMDYINFLATNRTKMNAELLRGFKEQVEGYLNYLFLYREVQYLEAKYKKISSTQPNLEKTENLLNKITIEKKQLENTIRELESTIKNLNTELAKKEKNSPEYAIKLIEQLYSDIRTKDAEVTRLNKKIIEMQKNPGRNLYQTLMDNQDNEIINLKIKLKELKEEQKRNSKTLENPIKFIKEYFEINGVSQELYHFLKPFMVTTEALMEDEINKAIQVEITSTEEKVQLRNYLGYVTFENNDYYLVAGNNVKIKINEIPERTYLAEKQFGLVRSNGKFIATFPYEFVDGYRDFMIEEFGIVNIGTEMKVRTADNHYYDVSDYKGTLWDKTIVALNREHSILKYYKQAFYDLDDYYNHATSKNHKFYFVEEVLPSALLLRDVETDEVFETDKISYKDVVIDEKVTIAVHDNQVVSAFYNQRFYTGSDLYTGYISGIVEAIEGEFCLRTLQGEVHSIIKYPKTMTEGDYCTIDEFGNYLRKETVLSFNELSKPKPNGIRFKIQEEEKEDLPEIIASVLIIGNMHYQKSYKETLRKKGFDVTVISGFDSFSNLIGETKDKDYIILNPSHVSHDNMWRLKETDLSIIYSKSDGANRILDELTTSNNYKQ